MSLSFVLADKTAIPLVALKKEELTNWTESQTKSHQVWLKASGFAANAGQTLVFPAKNGGIEMAVVGLGDAGDHKRGRFLFGLARTSLPAGNYVLANDTLTDDALEEAALGWLLAGYQFDRYVKAARPKAELVAPAGLDAKRIEIIAQSEALTRDLINTPASDMGPAELENAALSLAAEFDASATVIVDDELLKQNLPMIHAVGRASDRAPRLIDIRWGNGGPKLTLVGKGVCFDTGGLNIKPGASMGLMKKDMGGSAAVLGLARMIMALELPLTLRVLIPAVENSIGGDAFRPQDILTARNGLTVEINNTDAEGRLVLADALTLADEDNPDLILSMATLTGAARVAVGPDLAPFFATHDADAQMISSAGKRARDPVWQLPFWDPYEQMIEPGVADLDNAPKGGFAGSITAALFLRRFVQNTDRYVHFDIYGWQPAAAPARPKGGVGQGTRAILDALPALLKL